MEAASAVVSPHHTPAPPSPFADSCRGCHLACFFSQLLEDLSGSTYMLIRGTLLSLLQGGCSWAPQPLEGGSHEQATGK